MPPHESPTAPSLGLLVRPFPEVLPPRQSFGYLFLESRVEGYKSFIFFLADGVQVLNCFLFPIALAVEEFETAMGPADYALFDGGRCLGVAEAKKLTLGPQGVLVQAERYSSFPRPSL